MHVVRSNHTDDVTMTIDDVQKSRLSFSGSTFHPMPRCRRPQPVKNGDRPGNGKQCPPLDQRMKTHQHAGVNVNDNGRPPAEPSRSGPRSHGLGSTTRWYQAVSTQLTTVLCTATRRRKSRQDGVAHHHPLLPKHHHRAAANSEPTAEEGERQQDSCTKTRRRCPPGD